MSSKGNGCTECKGRSKQTKMQKSWLSSLNLPNDRDHREFSFRIDNKNYQFDGYNGSTNTVYEFNGDYWHGNPKVYSPEKINPSTGTSFGSLYDKTINKEKIIIKHGFNLITMWEHDWKLIKKNIK
jgi:hypothetical protein